MPPRRVPGLASAHHRQQRFQSDGVVCDVAGGGDEQLRGAILSAGCLRCLVGQASAVSVTINTATAARHGLLMPTTGTKYRRDAVMPPEKHHSYGRPPMFLRWSACRAIAPVDRRRLMQKRADIAKKRRLSATLARCERLAAASASAKESCKKPGAAILSFGGRCAAATQDAR